MSGGTTQTQTNSISPWMEEAAKSQLGKATALTDINQNPYKQYEGQRIAEFNPMQQQYFQGVQNLQGSGAIGQGIGAAGEATQRALGTSYNPYATGQFGAQAGQYMDPYMQNVVDIQQREAQRQADIAGTQRGAQAVKAGAFGGSRQAIENAEAARNLATQKGDIQARGLQDAYTRGQQQFNTEQQLREQSRQYGAGLGMQGLQTALSGASQLGGLGSTQFGQQKDVLGLQSVAGAQQQAQEQAKLSQGYEDFLAKEKYPYQQLEFMSNIMRGTPYGTTTSMYSPGPSTASTLLGAGTSLAGAYMMGGGKFFKSGGLADAYAAGGSVDSPDNVQSIADNLSDAQLQQAAAMAQARGDKEQADIIQQEMASRAALRSGASAMPEDQGIGQLPAGNMTYANGGIIAFADGGDVERYQFGGATQIEQILKKPPFQRTPEENALLTTAGYKLQRGVIPQGSTVDAANTALKGVGPSLRNTFTAGTNQLTDEQLAQMPAAGGALNEKILRGLGSTPASALTATPTAVAQAAPTNSTAAMAAKASASPYVSTPKSAEETALLGRFPTTKPVARTEGIAQVAPATKTASAAPAGLSMANDLARMDVDKLTTDALKAAEKQPNPFAKEIEAVGADKVAAKQAEVAGLEAIQKQFSDIFKGRKERLDTKQGEIDKMGNQSLGLSLLQAGAAMMSTPGGIGMALGKGVDVGTKQYAAGLDKINAAKEKLADARDRLEEIEAQRGELSAREMFKAKSEVKNTQISAKEDLIKANMQMYNVNRETALKMVDAKIRVASTVYEQQQANARSAAQIAASKNSQLELLRAVQADPKLADAYRALHGKGVDVMGEYNDYLKANPMLAADPKAAMTQFLMTKSVFSQLGGGTVTDKPSTKLRTQP